MERKYTEEEINCIKRAIIVANSDIKQIKNELLSDKLNFNQIDQKKSLILGKERYIEDLQKKLK